MRRAVLALGSTIAGLALLLSFKSHGATSGANAATASPGTSTPAQSGGTVNGPGSAAGTGSAAAGSGGPGGPGTSGGPGTAGGAAGSRGAQDGQGGSATRTVTGAVDTTQYGPMQVQLTLTGQRITKVTVLQRTDTGTESNQIDAFAIPKLTSETLAAQSARIDAVSGASYTSAGYIKSLQSAVDKARS
jgi:uncharacterized protein with FMN-binding domain